MEEKYSLDNTAEHLKQYAEARWNLIRLDMTDKISSTVSSLTSVILIGLLSLFILLFLSIGVAWWIGQQNGNPSMGFFIVAGIYLFIVLILYFLRERLIKLPIVNLLINKLHNDED